MNKQRVILFLIFLQNIGGIYAQEWTKEDSVWLQNVLSGKEKLKLNIDVLKAIETENLISPDKLNSPMLSVPTHLPITKDIMGAAMPLDTCVKKTDPYSIPPSVFVLYGMEAVRKLNLNKKILTPSAAFRNDFGSPVNTSNGNASVVVSFSAEDLLESIFWKSARDKKRNRKRTAILKYYYNANR